MKKILEIWLWHYSGDSRIFFKQAVSLSNEFNVKCLWWFFSLKKWSWFENWINNIENIWLTWNRLLILFKAIIYWLKNKSDIYVAHDIDSYIVVVFIKLFRWNSKIVFDSHEYYEKLDIKKLNFVWRIVYIFYLYILKPISIKLFSWVTVVTEDMKDYYNISNKEIIYNFPYWKLFDDIKSNNKLSKKYFYFIYHWWINVDRWLFEMLEIFNEYKKINKEIKFLLIWPFKWLNLEKQFVEKVTKIWLIDDIIITWKLSYNETISYIKNDVKKIWFCLFDNVWQMSKTIPIKMLEYLYLGIPQIWSNHINSFNNFINKNNAWISVEYWNIENELEWIKNIFNNYEEYKNNCNKIKSSFTWENEEEKLLKFYKNL